MSLGRNLVALTLIFSFMFFFYCNKNNKLDEAELLIKQKKYEEALKAIDAILAKDTNNQKAQLLRINAAMLQKSQERNIEAKDTASVKKNNQPQSRMEIKKVTEELSSDNRNNFSIMSLCEDKENKSVKDLTKKLTNN
jgi:hypothetical protein